MKNLVLLFGLFLMLIVSSCEESVVPTPEDEDNNTETENKIKPQDLVGDWDFVSLQFEGITYTGCDPYLTDDYWYVTLSFYDVTESEMRLYDGCEDGSNTYEYDINENMIICEDNTREFQIMNYDSFEGDTLELKFVEPSDYNVLPIGGIYTMAKQ
jgi:hypothetical protein